MERYWLEQAPPLVILLRGAPGSGKSTWAAHYKAKWASEAWVISATDYFRDHAGIVQFRSPWLSQSHLWCRNALYWLCQLRIPRIVIDNTHVHLWEYKEAAFIARAHHYRVFQHVCTGTWQNVNNVPDQLVRKMRAEFEHDADVPHYDEEKS
jgi:predicted kinase